MISGLRVILIQIIAIASFAVVGASLARIDSAIALFTDDVCGNIAIGGVDHGVRWLQVVGARGCRYVRNRTLDETPGSLRGEPRPTVSAGSESHSVEANARLSPRGAVCTIGMRHSTEARPTSPQGSRVTRCRLGPRFSRNAWVPPAMTCQAPRGDELPRRCCGITHWVAPC